MAGTSFGIVLPTFARAVPEDRRAWAFGLGTAAGSLGQFVVVPLMQQLIEYVRWEQASYYLGLSALLMALLAIPLAAALPWPIEQRSHVASLKPA